jgi:nicotinate-nucleotide adenylyltransferase
LKIGILGGTFDPVHLGHLRTAEEIGQELSLDKVYLIPSASPPHKTNDPITAFHHRLTMTRLAVAESPWLEILDLEGRRPGPSYSIETLKEIHGYFGSQLDLFFLLGSDAFIEIETWKDYRKLFEYSHFVIVQRAGHERKDLRSFLQALDLDVNAYDNSDIIRLSSGKRILIIKTTLLDISSTRIRELVRSGRSIRFLVSEPVRNYISKCGLYRDE